MGKGKQIRNYRDNKPSPSLSDSLKTLRSLVTIRLNSDANIIHSMRVRDVEQLPETINTLELLVPEFVNEVGDVV